MFDLDDTLYNVQHYATDAMQTVSDYLAVKYSLSQTDVYIELMTLWESKTSAYPRLFNDLLDNIGVSDKEVPNVVELFNNHKPEIKTHAGVVAVLQELKKRKYKLGIITNGMPERQERKIKALEIGHFFDEIVFAKRMGKQKPSPVPYRLMIDMLNVTPENSFYVGDNPLIDFEGAKEVGMGTIRVVKGEFECIPSDENVDCEIDEIEELLEVIESCESL